MDANFTPEMKPYKENKPLKFKANRILPCAYDDSISGMELLCKVVAKLNEVIDMVNKLEGEIHGN